MTSFVGRRRELAEVRRLLEAARLVTLTGVGGVGKTRLALRVAGDARRAFPDGVWLVELAGVREPDLLAQTVAEALGLPDQSARDPVDGLVEHVAGRRLLLVLDTCEHLVDGCAMLAEVLLRAAPGLRILATSRQPLDVPGEHTTVVAPLRGAERDDALTLFVERAGAVVPGFAMDARNRDQIVRLCDRLEGIPLAIELAAVRLRAMTVGQLLERLDDRFGLTRARRTGLARHQTLHAAVGWSHELCTPAERLLWARLSVFAGDFDLEGAEAVCADDLIPADAVLELISGLVGKSVLVHRQSTGRYGMLDTLREFGAEQLEQLGETRTWRCRHLDHYLRLAVRAEDALTTSAQAEWFVRLRHEQVELRAALEGAGDEAALRLVAALGTTWVARGMLREARHWFGRALAAGGGDVRDRVRAGYLDATAAILQGRAGAAAERLDRARELAQEGELAYLVEVEGAVAYAGGDLERARELLERSAAAHREAGHRDVFVLLNQVFLAGALGFGGELEAALATCDGIVRVGEQTGELWCRSHALWTRGLIRLLLGQVDKAGADGRACLVIARRLDDRLSLMSGLDVLAGCAAVAGDHERAARLAGGVDEMRRRHGASPLGAQAVALREAMEAELRSAYGDAATDLALESGARLDVPGLVAYALGEEDDRAAGGVARALLTRREDEVAGLVAEGLSNREIADRLMIAKRTVDSHLEHILAKLDFGSRAQIAAWVSERRE